MDAIGHMNDPEVLDVVTCSAIKQVRCESKLKVAIFFFLYYKLNGTIEDLVQ
jgi:hypothetical protein